MSIIIAALFSFLWKLPSVETETLYVFGSKGIISWIMFVNPTKRSDSWLICLHFNYHLITLYVHRMDENFKEIIIKHEHETAISFVQFMYIHITCTCIMQKSNNFLSGKNKKVDFFSKRTLSFHYCSNRNCVNYICRVTWHKNNHKK